MRLNQNFSIGKRVFQVAILLLLLAVILLHWQGYREEACKSLKQVEIMKGNGTLILVNNLTIPIRAYINHTATVIPPGGVAEIETSAVIDACLFFCTIELGCKVEIGS